MNQLQINNSPIKMPSDDLDHYSHLFKGGIDPIAKRLLDHILYLQETIDDKGIAEQLEIAKEDAQYWKDVATDLEDEKKRLESLLREHNISY